MNTTKKMKLADYDVQIVGLLTNAKVQLYNAMKELLAPYGEEGVELNYHCEGCYRPMCETKPNQFSVINNLRYYNDVLSMQIDDDSEWIELFMPCDLHFLWNELIDTLDYLYENEEEEFVMYFMEFKKIWENYGSFNELLGCAKAHIDNTELVIDVDAYNNNDIACVITYKGRLSIEFFYLHKEDKPFKVEGVRFDNNPISYEDYKDLL
jgi:hypothetical protein